MQVHFCHPDNTFIHESRSMPRSILRWVLGCGLKQAQGRFLFPLPSGNLGEAEVIMKLVKHPKHMVVRIRVSFPKGALGTYYQYKWGEDNPFPPFQFVSQAPFYTEPEYQYLRDRLKSPVPKPQLTLSTGKSYATMDATTCKMTDQGLDSEKCDSRPICLYLPHFSKERD